MPCELAMDDGCRHCGPFERLPGPPGIARTIGDYEHAAPLPYRSLRLDKPQAIAARPVQSRTDDRSRHPPHCHSEKDRDRGQESRKYRHQGLAGISNASNLTPDGWRIATSAIVCNPY